MLNVSTAEPRGKVDRGLRMIGAILVTAVVVYFIGFGLGLYDSVSATNYLSRPGNGKWQRVRTEFEFESRNFMAHGHDAKASDLIICWEHNWTECPLEVVELKEAFRKQFAAAPE